MIIDKIENRGRYKLPPEMEEALEYIAENDLAAVEAGKLTLPSGKKLKVDDYIPEKEGGKYEGHEHTAHLRYLVSGSEQLGYADKSEMTFSNLVEGKEDKALYDGTGSILRVTPGTFVVLYPEDCHLLKLKDNGSPVRKVSISVKM